MTTFFTHADLGGVRGNDNDGVVQFLGIKYASLKDRFSAASLVSDYGSGSIDATAFGYRILASPTDSC